jgi:hypothetical protein
VANLQTLVLQNIVLTTITDLVGGYNGQILAVASNEPPTASTLQHGTNILLTSGADELALRSARYDFRSALGPDDTTPVWRQLNQYFPAPTMQMETTNYLSAGITAGAAPTRITFQAILNELGRNKKADR